MSILAAHPALRDDVGIIGLVSVAHGASHFCQLIVPPLFPWIGAAFSLSNTQLGLLMSAYFIVSCGGQAVAGFVVDRFGPQRVLFGGLFLVGLAALGLAVSPSYGVMFVFMAMAGLGNCVFHPVDFSILNARVSAPRLGHAYAAHGISGNVGWALAPVFVVGITTATGSWRTALGSVALVVALALGLGQCSALVVLALFALMGLGAGIAGPSRDLLVKAATPPGATGRVYGVVYSGLDVGLTLAPLAFGAMMDAGQFRGVWLGIALMLGLLIVTAVNVKRSASPAAP